MAAAPFDWLFCELAALSDAGLRRERRPAQPLAGGRVIVGGKTLVNFAGNDYLDLAGDVRLLDAAIGACRQGGTVGAQASAHVCGRSPALEQLEADLARFEGTEAALVFPTGYAANIGAITALAGPDDAVFCDRLNHHSLIEGSRLSRARFRVYPHMDVDRLNHELAKHSSVRRKLIVTDGVFSMDGDAAPLPQLCDVAERHGAMLLVDEAHATGVLGDHGRGTAEWLGVEHRPMVRVGTLSKAIGAQGGFVAGTRTLIDWLANRAGSQMFSTALAPPLCAAASAAIRIIETEPWRREQLLERSAALCATLRRSAIAIDDGVVGPIIPIILSEAAGTLTAAAQLAEAGLFVAAIRPPTVPRGTARLRISLSTAHTVGDIEQLAAAIAGVV